MVEKVIKGAFIVAKKRDNKRYLYIQKSISENGKQKTKALEFLGEEEQLKNKYGEKYINFLKERLDKHRKREVKKPEYSFFKQLNKNGILKIKDLRDKMGHIDIKAIVIGTEPLRYILRCYVCYFKDTSYEKTTICPKCNSELYVQKVKTVVIRDDTGKCQLCLWRKYTDVDIEDEIILKNGYAKYIEYKKQGIMVRTFRLTTGKDGTLEIIKKGEINAETNVNNEPITA